MKLFYVQSSTNWCNLYKIAEELDIEAYEIKVDEPIRSADEYDKTSSANKICLWDEEKYGSDLAPHNRARLMCGEYVSMSWYDSDDKNTPGAYTNKIKEKIPSGDDVILAVSSNSDEMINFFQSIQKEYNLRLHFIAWRDFPNRVDDDALLLRYLPYVQNAASIVICNGRGLYQPYIVSFAKNKRNDNWQQDMLECNELFLETARDYLKVVKNTFEYTKGFTKASGELLLYEFGTGKIRNINVNDIEFADLSEIRMRGEFPYESITPGLNHDTCRKLREYREAFKEKYDAKPRMYYPHHYGYDTKKQEIDERRCEYKKNCRGTCKACDSFSEQLFLGSKLAGNFSNKDSVKDNELYAPINGIDRLRMDIDGKGVRSLVLMDACYLNCKYCINRSTVNRFPLIYNLEVMELGYVIRKDIPYFDQTGGGLTFGGGEPLIYAEFIHQFHEYLPKISINVETSLNVEKRNVVLLIDDIDEWIIDIKDMNPDIYYNYTGTHNSQVVSNLVYLLQHVDPSRIRCRVPLIEGFNTEEDVNESIKQLKDIGIERIEKFKYK